MFSDDAVLPDEAVLLHVGPFKTGTTALQTAFDAQKKDLRERGIWWASTDRRHIRAAVATFTGALPTLPLEVGAQRWQRLVQEVGASTERVVISSEFLSEADAAAAATIVAELGGLRIHAVLTLRPIAWVLASQWQQFAQAKKVAPYEEWLREILDAQDRSTLLFWRRHDQPALVERWAAAAGPDNVCVVALDEADRTSVTQAFEHMLRLDPGYLVPKRIGSNRSLTYGELEMVRLMRETFAKRGWSEQFYDALMRHGAVSRLLHEHQPEPDEPRLVTPQWALERAREFGEDAAERIRRSGVRVIGDLANLAVVPDSGNAGQAAGDVPMMTAQAAYQAVLGAIEGSRVTEAKAAPEPLDGPALAKARRRWARAEKRHQNGARATIELAPTVDPPRTASPLVSAKRWARHQRRRLQRSSS